MAGQEITDKINDLESRIERIEGILHNSQSHSGGVGDSSKKLSIKEFMLAKKPKDDLQRTLVIASYLENESKYESFTAEDLKRGFREARVSPPANINDKVNKNIAKGLFMSADKPKDGKKAWVITATGEQVIANSFEVGQNE